MDEKYPLVSVQRNEPSNLYKGKDEALHRGNYRGFKFTEQVTKLLKRILDFCICKMVNIDGQQFGFVPGKGTTEAIFVVYQLQEECIAINKLLYFAFIDLEKAFDWGTWKILWRCRVAWGKFGRLLPPLTTRHFSPKLRGKVCNVCVDSAMLHGTEPWKLNTSDLQGLCRNDPAMIHWICVTNPSA